MRMKPNLTIPEFAKPGPPVPTVPPTTAPQQQAAGKKVPPVGSKKGHRFDAEARKRARTEPSAPNRAITSEPIRAVPLGAVSEKGSTSNRLLPVSTYHSDLFDISDYLLKILLGIQELEKTPAKLKEQDREICRLTSEVSKLQSIIKDQTKALKRADVAMARFEEEKCRVARESIITYAATDTFAHLRTTEFWANVESFVLPYFRAFTNYVKNVKGVDVPEFDPAWLTHEGIHQFPRLWGGEEAGGLDPIPEKPQSEESLWDLEARGKAKGATSGARRPSPSRGSPCRYGGGW